MSLLILATILSLFTFFLIRRGKDSTAGETLGNYLNALIGGRTEEAYHYLSAQDCARESLADYKMRCSLGSGLIANMIARNITFTIETTDTDHDRATAIATITAPDFTGIMGDVLQDVGSDRLPAGNLDSYIFVCQKISHFLDKYQRESIPMRTDTALFRLILERSGWKICLEDL